MLGMLAQGPMTGYRLREEIQASVGHFWQESFGQLYPTLGTLEREGLVRRGSGGGRAGGGRAGGGRAAPFELTAAGRRALRKWLAAEPESLASERNELLLKIFFGRHAEPGVLRGHLQRHRARLEEARVSYRDLEDLVAAEDSPDRAYWLITVRHGRALVDAGLSWNAGATAILEEQEQG